MQPSSNCIAVLAQSCTARALLPSLLIQLMGLFIFCAMDFQKLCVL